MDGNDRSGLDAAARVVQLRDEVTGDDRRYLRAYVDDLGRLHIDGHDLGPGTEAVSSDGEYEWYQHIAAADVPRVVTLLGGAEGQDVLDLLAERYCGEASYELEAALRDCDIEIERHVWSG